jgi:hypothetical protein
MFGFLFLGVTWAAAMVRIAFLPTAARTLHSSTDVILQFTLVGVVGLGGLFAASGHLFNGREVAAGIGWAPDNPFQAEVGFANLAFGILGVLCAWQGPAFWAAVAIGEAVFLFGAGTTHVRDLRRRGNRSPLNAGPMLWFDFVLPTALLGLLVAHRLSSAG